jgi:hypothetical protein
MAAVARVDAALEALCAIDFGKPKERLLERLYVTTAVRREPADGHEPASPTPRRPPGLLPFWAFCGEKPVSP